MRLSPDFLGLSELGQFLEVLRLMGIKHEVHHSPGQASADYFKGGVAFLKQAIKQCGFDITHLALTAVILGDRWYIFSVGAPHWLTDEDTRGPFGAFMFSFTRDPVTMSGRDLQPRVHYKNSGPYGQDKGVSGLAAVLAEYGDTNSRGG